MKRILITGAAMAGLLASATASTLIIPAFGNNSAQFNGIARTARSQNLTTIINPNEGVGSSRSGKVAKFVKSVQGAGSEAIGYMVTNYGSRNIGSVKSDINAYVSRYGVDGIFLDEVSDSKSQLGYYRELYNFAKSKGLRVFLNPGTFVHEGYAKVSDVIITYEDFYSNGYSKFKQKSWTKKYSKNKFGVIVNSTSNYSGVVSQAKSQNVEYVYATDAQEPSPYGRLPSNFEDLTSQTSGGAASGGSSAAGGGRGFSSVPEPTSLLSVLLTSALLSFRRRRAGR